MRIPIAMFHQVDDLDPEFLKDWSISNQKFSAFLHLIEHAGFKTTTFQEIIEQGLNTRQLQKKIIITFDDCAAGLMNFAVPELIKRGMKAVFYIPTGQIGGYNQWDVEEQGFEKIELMTEAHLKFLSQNGMEIGSHGHRHLRHNLVDEIQVAEEVNHSKEVLERLLNKPVYSMAHPYGEVSKHHQELMQKVGYCYGVGIYKAFENNFCLRRFGIHQSDTPKSMRFKLSKRYKLLRMILDPLLQIKKNLGLN